MTTNEGEDDSEVNKRWRWNVLEMVTLEREHFTIFMFIEIVMRSNGNHCANNNSPHRYMLSHEAQYR
jgi:hypothetical protein